ELGRRRLAHVARETRAPRDRALELDEQRIRIDAAAPARLLEAQLALAAEVDAVALQDARALGVRGDDVGDGGLGAQGHENDLLAAAVAGGVPTVTAAPPTRWRPRPRSLCSGTERHGTTGE